MTARKKHEFHGRVSSRAYASYRSMKKRCLNLKSSQYQWYGGRGITVCERWVASFMSFLEDMGEPPTEEHTIDRIDPNGNYEPSNCRWATMQEQQEHMRERITSRMITWNGKTQSVTAWAEETGIKRHTIYARLNSGWSVDDVFTRKARVGVSPGGWRTLNPESRGTVSFLTFNGETLTIADWAKRLGITRSAIYQRIRKDLPIEEILYAGRMKTGPGKMVAGP